MLKSRSESVTNTRTVAITCKHANHLSHVKKRRTTQCKTFEKLISVTNLSKGLRNAILERDRQNTGMKCNYKYPN